MTRADDGLAQRLAAYLPDEQTALAPKLAEEAHDWARRQSGAGQGSAEERFRALFDAVYDPIFLVDARGERIVEANRAAATLLGFDPAELQRLNPSDLHPFEMEQVREFFAKIAEHGQWQTRELTCRRRDGHFVPAEMSGTHTLIDGRECFVVVVRDLRQHQLALLGTAVSKVAHDLRNVLHSMRLFSRSLRNVDDPTAKQVLPRLQATVDRAIRLCDATLAQGRVQEPSPAKEQLHIRPLADEAAEMAGLTGEGSIDWINEIPQELVVAADADQLFRVLLNLMRNAVRAIEEGPGTGTVRALGAKKTGGVTVELADTGPGLPEPLESLVGAQSRTPWRSQTGLGLSIASDLVRAHGGELDVAESSSAGTRLTVWLPAGE